MKDKPILGLAPMLEALGVEQTVSFNDCYALLKAHKLRPPKE